VTRRVPAQRRSRRRVEQMLHAAAELLAEGGVDALTMRSLAGRTGIPIATIYRYFANRDAIIAAYLEHNLREIQGSLRTALLELDNVTFRSAVQAVLLAHLRYHQAHPESTPVWFGGRLNPVVTSTVRELDSELAAAWRAALKTTGILSATPQFNADLLVHLSDRMLEFVFSEPRTTAEQEDIVLSFVDMIAGHMERFETPIGHEGVSAQRFLLALSEQEDRSRQSAATSIDAAIVETA
jgi:AcrR family transcriptional regulator